MTSFKVSLQRGNFIIVIKEIFFTFQRAFELLQLIVISPLGKKKKRIHDCQNRGNEAFHLFLQNYITLNYR